MGNEREQILELTRTLLVDFLKREMSASCWS